MSGRPDPNDTICPHGIDTGSWVCADCAEVDALRAEVRQLKDEKEEILKAPYRRSVWECETKLTTAEAQVASLIDQLAARTDQRDAAIETQETLDEMLRNSHEARQDLGDQIRELETRAEAAEQHGAHLAHEIQEYQQSFALCEMHTPALWEGDGTCVICEAVEQHTRLAVAEASATALRQQLEGLIDAVQEYDRGYPLLRFPRERYRDAVIKAAREIAALAALAETPPKEHP